MTRLLTLNIRGGLGSWLRPLTAFLAEQDADILCLQECAQAVVPWLQAQLPGGPWQAAYAPATFQGSAVLTRLPLQRSRALTLDTPGRAELRSAVDAHIEVPGGLLRVVCTHLDHVLEDLRLMQWEALSARTDGVAGGLLVGDLNALSRGDYDAQAWARIAAERAAGRWEAPDHRLLDALLGAGFADACAGQEVWMTSRFDTRIDYILAAPDCPFVLRDAAMVPALSAGVTDHNGVAVTVSASG